MICTTVHLVDIERSCLLLKNSYIQILILKKFRESKINYMIQTFTTQITKFGFKRVDFTSYRTKIAAQKHVHYKRVVSISN